MRAAPDTADAYERQGFVCPLAALPAAEAAAYRRELEAIERDAAGHPRLVNAL